MDPVISGGLIALLGAVAGALAAHVLEKSARSGERREQELRAEGRVSANAYAVYRQFAEWLREWPEEDDGGLLEHVRAVATSANFDPAEQRIHAIVSESLNASESTANHAQELLALFYSATAILNEGRVQARLEGTTYTPSTGRVEGEATLVRPWPKRFEKARRELEACRGLSESLMHPRLTALKNTLGELVSTRYLEKLRRERDS